MVLFGGSYQRYKCHLVVNFRRNIDCLNLNLLKFVFPDSFRALNGDDDSMFDDTPKSMEEILTEIRSLMQDYSVTAYIVPSVDAHNVIPV